MLVYGDVRRQADPREEAARFLEAVEAARGLRPGLARHAALAGALIAAGELIQGVADAEEAGRDGQGGATDRLTGLLVRLAGAVWASWRSGFATGEVPDRAAVERACAGLTPEPLEIRLPEGFAFYAVYPESYAEAACASGLDAGAIVIGIRSIGTTLGAMVAAGLGGADLVTVRPSGHPFRRELPLRPSLQDRLGPDRRIAVADEGPGLSGSSFASVLSALRERGIGSDRVVLFPSHDGEPGHAAAEETRRLYGGTRRLVRTFDDLVLRAERPEHRLEAWLAPLIGPLTAPLEEISGGAWRTHRDGDRGAWPPAHPMQERRKFLARAASGTWLVKFVGLGAEGERKVARARALHAAGFTPEVAGFRHGFLVERWIEGATPLDRSRIDPVRLVERVGHYLGYRATAFPAGRGRGASLAALWEMARHNAAQALGAEQARRLDGWRAALPRFDAGMRPVETDSRLHAWEWLVLRDGTLLKTDAVDHHAGHDLVGCQDVAWDIAGAAVELGLDDAARRHLAADVARRTGREVDPGFVAYLEICYTAFQLGAMTMAGDAASDPGEQARLRDAADRYRAHLASRLSAATLP
ncbi:hypothetical protein [Methylobacterium nonmethylotrophicum]|uniref:Uncharacterized protein n=1 Tax=Methylobacterium nonmethylotrophicum TaxID=1141884 RepID=A0A4Z0NSJ3_9HYPH|nr:hypothetical protein [Methylobacterium nonmethylotrophicum]TGE00243.1 hypothetical protein EU555_10120 [Methylobacterium nonmethylotrophicum]